MCYSILLYIVYNISFEILFLFTVWNILSLQFNRGWKVTKEIQDNPVTT